MLSTSRGQGFQISTYTPCVTFNRLPDVLGLDPQLASLAAETGISVMGCVFLGGGRDVVWTFQIGTKSTPTSNSEILTLEAKGGDAYDLLLEKESANVFTVWYGARVVPFHAQIEGPVESSICRITSRYRMFGRRGIPLGAETFIKVWPRKRYPFLAANAPMKEGFLYGGLW